MRQARAAGTLVGVSRNDFNFPKDELPNSPSKERQGTVLLAMLEARRRMFSRIRIVSLFLLLSAALLGGLAYVAERSQIRPQGTTVSISPAGELKLAVQRIDLLTAERDFALGAILPQDGDEPPIQRWLPRWTGIVSGLEHLNDGSVALYNFRSVLIFPPANDWPEVGMPEPKRLAWPPAVIGQSVAPAVAGDRVMVGWVTNQELSVLPAVTAEELGQLEHPVAIPAKLEGLGVVPDLVSLQHLGEDRYCFVTLTRPKGRSGAGHLDAWTFRLVTESVLVSPPPEDAAAESEAEAASDQPASEPAEGETDDGASDPAVPTEPSSEPADTPETEPIAEPVKQAFRIADLVAQRITVNAESFWSTGSGGKTVVVWRANRDGKRVYDACAGHSKEWTEIVRLNELEDGPVIGEAPVFAASQGRLELITFSPRSDAVTRNWLELDAENPEWKSGKELPLGHANLPFPVEGLWGLMLLLGCMGLVGVWWLAINRPRDAEAEVAAIVRDRTGRDPELLRAWQAATSDKILWGSILRRAIALIIDVLAISPVVLFICDAKGLDPNIALNLIPFNQETALEGVRERLVTLAVLAVYGFACEAWFGRTLGKAILKLRVVTVKGAQPSVIRIFIRNVMRMVELSISPLVLAAMICMMFTHRMQRLADLLLGLGVRIEPPPEDDDGPIGEGPGR